MPPLPLRRALRVLATCIALLASVLIADGASAATLTYRVALDSDSSAATGCTIASTNGPLAGIDQVVDISVTTSGAAATIGPVATRSCSGGALDSPSTIDAGGWPVGIGQGSDAADVIEVAMPLASLPPAASIRAVALADDGAGGSDATAAFTIVLAAAPPPAPPPIPVPLSPWLPVALGVGVLAGLEWLRRRHPQHLTLCLVVAVMLVSGVAWAAVVLLDGHIDDWRGVAPAASDPSGDAPVGVDIVGVYAQHDATKLYFRIDARVLAASANKRPVVDAGVAQTITLPDVATLTGRATDDGLPDPPGLLVYHWNKVSGPGSVTFSTPASATTTATFSAPGAYVLRLTADDGELIGTADVGVTVNTAGGSNMAPTVSAGLDQSITLPATASLSGSTSDDGLPNPPGALTLHWSLVSGPGSAVTFGDDGAASTTASFGGPGTYVLQLSASDGALTGSAKVTIAVQSGAPSIEAVADRTIVAGDHLQIPLVAADFGVPGGLNWALPTAPDGASLAPPPIVDWTPGSAQLGTHTFTATVTNGAAQTASVAFHVTVVAAANHKPRLAPQANQSINAGTALLRTLTASDPDGDALTFSLTSRPAGMSLAGAAISWPTGGVLPGDYAVTARVTDAGGLYDEGTFIVSVRGGAAALAEDDAYTVNVGATLTVPAPGVLGNDVSPIGSALSASKRSDPDKGSLGAFDADGSFTYVAPATAPIETSLAMTPLAGGLVNDSTGYSWSADVNHDGGADMVTTSFGTPMATDGKTGARLWTGWDTSQTSPGRYCLMYLFGTDFALGDIDDSGDVALVAGTNCDPTYTAGVATRLIALDTNPAHAVAGAARVKWVSERLDEKLLAAPPGGGMPVPTYALDPRGSGLLSWAVPTLARLTPGGAVKVLTRTLIGPNMYFFDRDGDGTRETDAGCAAATGDEADLGKTCTVTFIVDAATGVKEAALTAPNPRNWYSTTNSYPFRQLPVVVADLDGDGQVEIISGDDVFALVGGRWTLARQLAPLPGVINWFEPNSIAVADLDGDGKAEIVRQSDWDSDYSGRKRGFQVYASDGRMLHSFEVPTWGIGMTTIADVDGDEIPEIVFSARGVVYAYRADGTLLWASVFPDDDGTQPGDVPGRQYWPQPVGDRTRPGNAVQVYDLALDGSKQVIANGNFRIAIIDGRTGVVKSSIHHNGYYANNGVPQIVDADGDGHAEIFSAAAGTGVCGGCASVNTIPFAGEHRDWAPAPMVFNQTNYNPWAVDDAGAIRYDGGVHRSFRNQRQVGNVVDARTRDTATFTYAATDAGGTSAPASVRVQIVPPNRPPVITSTPPSAIDVVLDSSGHYPSFVYQVAAIDPDVGDTVHYELVYSTINTYYFPQVTVNPVTGVMNMYTGPCGSYGGPCDMGTLLVVVAAIDSFGARSEQSFHVDVTYIKQTVPDVVGQSVEDGKAAVAAATLTPKVSVVFDTHAAGTVIAQDPAAGTALVRHGTVLLTVSKGPAPATMPYLIGKQVTEAARVLGNATIDFIVDPVASTTVPAGEVMTQDPAYGARVVPGVDGAATLGVSIGPPLGKPIASMVVEPGETTRLVADTLAYKATAIFTDGTSADVTLRAAWSSSLPSVASVDVTGAVKGVGAGDAVVSASLSGKSAGSALHVKTHLADVTDPTAAIVAPADDSTVVGRVDVTGTASDANFLRYELAFATAGSDDWVLLGEGAAPVVGGVLGSFDPTVLLNDLYTLRLRVVDRSNNVSEATTTVQVAGQRKVGLFSLAFEDLSLPATGVPVAVVRTYDSRDKAKGDFGIGWRQSFNTLRIRANRVPGTGWVRTVSGPTVSLAPTSAHAVSVTLVDGSVQVFDLQISPTSNIGSLDATHVSGYTPRAGTRGSLSALGNVDLLIVGAGSEDVLVDDNTLEPFAPALYRYVGDDGTTFDLSPVDGVHRIADRNGNTVTFGRDGIVHSNGRSVSFTRDADDRIVAVTDPLGHARTYTYDGNGDLASMTDPLGRTTTFSYDRRHGLLEIRDASGQPVTRTEYDDAGRLVAIIDANGNRLAIAHDDDAQQDVITDRRGHTTTVRYDERGNIVSRARVVTIEGVPTAAVETSVFDGLGNETSSVDADGRRIDRTFDDDRPRTIVRDPAGLGLETQLSYTTANLVGGVVDPGGREWDFGYDAGGNIVSQSMPGTGALTMTRDAAGRVMSTVNAEGTRHLVAYDGAGNVVRDETRDAADHLMRRTDRAWDANGNLTQETRYRTVDGVLTPFATRYAYDALDRLTAVTDALGNVSRTEYDDAGRVAAEIDARGARTEYAYDALGRLVLTRHPDGTQESSVYDASNNVVAAVDRMGRTWTYAFDELDRRIAVTRPGGATARSVYTAGGQLAATIDATGQRTDYAYDSAGRQTSTRFPAVRNGVAGPDARPVVARTLDAGGREIATTDADGRVTGYAYDAEGRRTRIVQPDGSHVTTTWDALGRQASITNEDNETTNFSYDALGRIKGVSGAAGAIGYQWDEMDNLVAWTDALGRVTQFRFDALGRPTQRRYPSGATETLAYDAAGNVVARTDSAGRTTSFAVDAMGRLVERRMPDGSRETYAYNGDDKRTAVTDASGTTQYAYDEAGRLAKVTLPDGATITYSHDANDNLASLATAAGTASYSYDALDRLTGIAGIGGATQYFYDLSGDRVRSARSNGVLTDVTYDSRRRPISIAHTRGATTLQSFVTEYSASGRRTRVTEATGTVETFGYDALGRLVANARTGPEGYTQSYGYDAVGNRTQLVRNGTSTAYSYDADDRLLTAGGATFGYDANGNRSSRSEGGMTISYGYDTRDRLVTVQAGGGSEQYRYDVDGNRVAVSDVAGTTTLVVAAANPTGWPQVVEERRAGGATAASYAWADGLATIVAGGDTRYPLRDALGGLRGLSATDGTQSDRYVYDAWGRTVVAEGGSHNPYRFDGEREDSSSGLYDLRARRYDPDSGRFLTRDPSGGRAESPISRHRYAFANDDPANVVDPGGKEGLASLIVAQEINSVIDAAFEAGTKIRAMCSLKDRLDLVGNLVMLGQLATGAVAAYQFFDVADEWSGPKVALSLYGINPAAFGTAVKKVEMKFEIPWNLAFNFSYANNVSRKIAIGPKGVFGSTSKKWWSRKGYQCGIPTAEISLISTVKGGGNTFNMSAAASASLAFRLQLFNAWQLDYPLLELGAKVKDFHAKGSNRGFGFAF